jgi:hypothetical protein
MNIYAELALVWAVVVFIVDLSGWTDTWLGWLSKWTRKYGLPAVKELRPFSCSQCMTWWCCLLWALLRKNFTLPVVAYSAALAHFSFTLCELFIFLRETLTNAIAKLNKWLND